MVHYTVNDIDRFELVFELVIKMYLVQSTITFALAIEAATTSSFLFRIFRKVVRDVKIPPPKFRKEMTPLSNSPTAFL